MPRSPKLRLLISGQKLLWTCATAAAVPLFHKLSPQDILVFTSVKPADKTLPKPDCAIVAAVPRTYHIERS